VRTPEQLETAVAMTFRNAIADIADVPYRVVEEGVSTNTPFVTIVIPTFKRLRF